jgi:hypothetical protein
VGSNPTSTATDIRDDAKLIGIVDPPCRSAPCAAAALVPPEAFLGRGEHGFEGVPRDDERGLVAALVLGCWRADQVADLGDVPEPALGGGSAEQRRGWQGRRLSADLETDPVIPGRGSAAGHLHDGQLP